MEIIKYPLLHFKINDEAVLGILVGTDYQVVEKDLKKVKSSIHGYLQKNYRKYDDYPVMDVYNPKLRMINVPIRPSYQDHTGAYPMSFKIDVPVPVVFGETQQGHYECFLPLFEQSFFYYESDQFDALVQHFTTNLLNQAGPEKIFNLLQYPDPELDFINLKVNFERDFDWSSFSHQRQFRVLNRLCERYPQPRYIQKTTTSLPEVAWELDDKVSQVFDKIVSTRSNVILIGNAGVGKSAVLKQVIRKITHQNKTFQLDFTFWRLMAQRITASSKYLGEWQEDVEEMIDELTVANGVLWVVDISQLIQTGGQGPEDSVAAFLIPYLNQGKIQIIGEATPEQLESMRRMLPGFIELFQTVEIEIPDKTLVQKILKRFSDYISDKYKIQIEKNALDQSIRLLSRYHPYESFPGKGIKFLGQCVNQALLKKKDQIGKRDIITNFIETTGLPELFLRDDILLNQQELADFFNRRIIGQPLAVNKLTGVVKVFKAGLNDPHKPISTMLFCGPTGVGKTASAKALADYFFGKGQKKSPLIRVDMSEFQYPEQIYRFIGNGREVGQLVKEIRERPFSVLLLDEIEKAHPAIFDILLSILDEGRIVDNYGRLTNFKNTIIIMTSNLGASNTQPIGYNNTEEASSRYISAIEKHFRPEFINRVDSLVLFRNLNANDIRKITLKELDELKNREGFTKRGLTLAFSDELIEHITKVGFDEKYGARPLQRAIEHRLVTPIANWLLVNNEIVNKKLIVKFNGQVIIQTARK